MLGKKRMIENFEIIHSIQIGARELVVGVSPELEFMCCFCTQDDIAEYSGDHGALRGQAERTDSGSSGPAQYPPYPAGYAGP